MSITLRADRAADQLVSEALAGGVVGQGHGLGGRRGRRGCRALPSAPLSTWHRWLRGCDFWAGFAFLLIATTPVAAFASLAPARSALQARRRTADSLGCIANARQAFVPAEDLPSRRKSAVKPSSRSAPPSAAEPLCPTQGRTPRQAAAPRSQAHLAANFALRQAPQQARPKPRGHCHRAVAKPCRRA